MLSQKTVLGLCAAIVLTRAPARANLAQNGSFENIGTQTHSFSIDVNATLPDWVESPTPDPTGSDVLNCLIVSTDTSDLCGAENGKAGWTLKFWVNPGPSPDGGNFVGMDGISTFSEPLSQTVNGLNVGKEYTISFWQAAAQQYGYDGETTERWKVELGDEVHRSTKMYNPEHDDIGWNQQKLTFTATAASELLQFIGVGTPNGEPPFVLLDGVDVEEVTPEPAAFGLMGIGLGLIFFGRWRLKRRG